MLVNLHHADVSFVGLAPVDVAVRIKLREAGFAARNIDQYGSVLELIADNFFNYRWVGFLSFFRKDNDLRSASVCVCDWSCVYLV
jgi:hypothetical protein